MKINLIAFILAAFFLGVVFGNAQQLTTSKSKYRPGEKIALSFSGGPSNAKDWVGIYKKGETPGDVSATSWLYVDGTRLSSQGKSSGQLVFEGLPLGNYEAHFLENDLYEIIASTAFVISEDNSAPVVIDQSLEMNEDDDGGSVISWTPVDGNGDPLDAMTVQSAQTGNGAKELISYDLSGRLIFDDKSVTTDGRYLAGTLSNTESEDFSVLWLVHYNANAPFASTGTYAYNIGINNTSHQRDDGAEGFVVEQYNGTTYAGEDIRIYDGIPTVWSTVLTSQGHSFYAKGKDLNVEGTAENMVRAGAEIVIGAYGSGGYDFVGEMQQLIIFNSALSDSDRAFVEGYLGNLEGQISGIPGLSTGALESLIVHYDGRTGVETPGLPITLTGSDEDGDSLSFTVVSEPTNGTLSGTAPNLIYNPNPNFSGDDSFTYMADDGELESNVATVTMSIANVNDDPVVTDQSVEVNEGGTVSITLAGSDGDGDDLFYTVVSQPSNGILSGTAPNLTYNPNANFSGDDSFTFKASDGVGDSNTATVTVSVIKQISAEINLTLSRTHYQEGEPIEIGFSDGPGNAKDWVGISREGDTTGEITIIEWQYVDGTWDGVVGKSTGQLVFDPLPIGSYEAYLFLNDGNTRLATANFDVAGSTLPEGVYFQANFDGLTLGAFESNGEKNGDGTDWTAQGPAGWVMRKGEGHGPTAGGAAVKEFDGWTFLDPVSWNGTAGQSRDQFTKGSGVIAVADSDEYDDQDDAAFDASLQTPSIDISGAVAHTLILKYDSSWRKEPHTGSVTVSYDGGPEIELLSLDGNSPDGFNETVQLELKNPDGARSLVVKWDYQGHNNWWWAIDNVTVANVGNKPKKWTILAYTQGDNNLAYFIGLQNKILEKIGSSKDVNIVIQTDYDMSRREELVNHLGEMDNDIGGLIHGTTRIVIGENPDGQWVKNTQIEERFLEGSKHENRMDDPEFFGEFLDWGMANYPAERYGLFFLDHGGSWYGFGADHQDGLGGGNAIKPRAFRREIQSSLEKAGSEKFYFINFYACLMGATEVLDAFDGLCDVFYANPEICYLWRWNHEIRAKFIGHLSNNPNIDNISLAQYEVANWMPPDGLEYEAKIGVHCAYDMSKYTAFKVAFKKFSEDLLAEAQARNPIILAARRNTTPYWLKSIQDLKNQTEFMDLAHFAEILSKSTTGDLKISSTVLTDAIQSLIIDKFVGSKRPDVSGLSIHYPVKGYEKGWKHSYDKTYFISSKTSDMDNWSEVPDPAAATGTGAIWSNFLREVNAMNGSTGSQTQFVLNNDGELVSSRSAEFGMAGSGVMTASTKRAVPIEFELESAEGLYDYFINLVSNRETDDPNQFIYLGELHRGLIKGNKKHQYYWDAKLPVLSLGGGGTKAPPVAPGEVDRKELIGEMPLYLGGWWSELSDDLMVSYADYQGPGEEDKTHLILMTKYLEGGVGILESTILDSSYEDALLDGDGENENKVAPVGVDFEFEPGGKLWPVYYMEEPDSENPGEWKPYFTWFKDGYIKIPGNGKDGLMIAWLSVEPGDYRAEVQVGDYFGNLSEELKFDIRVEDPFPGVPALQFSLEEAGGDVRFVLSWPLEMGGNEAILQRTDGIGREWSDVPSRDLGFGGAGRLYKESRTGEARFFRLIKR